jgi:hypothetical protein
MMIGSVRIEITPSVTAIADFAEINIGATKPTITITYRASGNAL